jgi:hypothetical protein
MVGLILPAAVARTGPNVSAVGTWWVEPSSLTAHVESRWSGSSLSFIEWTVPAGMSVRDVTVRDLRSWAQHGSRVQVWLERPSDEIAVVWRAWQPRGDAATVPIEIPAVAYPQAGSTSFTTRVRSTNGGTVVPSFKGPAPEILSSAAPGEISWKSPDSVPVEITLLPPPKNVPVRIRTSIRQVGDRCQSTTTIDLGALPRNRPQLLSVIVADSAKNDVQISAPPSATTAEVAARSEERRWDIGLPSGDGDRRLVTVTMTSESIAREVWRLPSTRVRFGPRHEAVADHRIVLESAGLALAVSRNLDQVGPSEWRTTGTDWTAEIGARDREHRAAARAQVIAAYSGDIWFYRGRFTISPGAVQLHPSAGSSIHRVEMDGTALTPPSDVVELPDSGREHSVVLEWSSRDFISSLPRIVGANGEIGFSSEWEIRVPAGLAIVGVGAHVLEESPSHVNSSDDIPEIFRRGTPRRFRVGEGRELQIQVTPARHSPSRVPLVAALFVLVAIGVLLLLRSRRTSPEQAAAMGVLAVLAMGPSALGFLLIPAVVAIWRGAKVVVRWAGGGGHPEPTWGIS